MSPVFTFFFEPESDEKDSVLGMLLHKRNRCVGDAAPVRCWHGKKDHETMRLYGINSVRARVV